MDLQTTMGFVRISVACLAGWAAGHGLVSNDDLNTIISASMIIAAAAWNYIHHKSVDDAINETATEVVTPKAIKQRILP